MDHQYIEDNQIAERYLMGQLPEPEVVRFEEHYLSCGDCLDRLELAERFDRALKGVAAEDAARSALATRVGLLAGLARLSRSRQASVVIAALFVLVLLPAGLLMREIGRLDSELERTRASLARRQDEGQRQEETLQDQLDALRGELAARQQQLDRELTVARQRADRLEQALSRERQPQVNLPILRLSPERSAAGAEPVNRITLAADPEWIVLSLEIEGPVYASYRATLRGADGNVVWQRADLERGPSGAVVLSVHSTMLAAGDYRLRLEGLPPGGESVAVGAFSFRVIR